MIHTITMEVIYMGFEVTVSASAMAAFVTSALGRSLAQKPSLKQASAGIMLSQFRNERLPLTIIVS